MMKTEIFDLLAPGHPWGQYLQVHDSLPSTNSLAKELAKEGAPQGTVVIAKSQTGGRGRLGRSFLSEEGGLYFSLILRPGCLPQALMHLTCWAGLAAAQAVEKASGIAPDIKWTNDLVVGRQKLGGILTELGLSPQGLVDFAVIGIGINCRQKHFPESIPGCSLYTLTGLDYSPALVAARLMETLAVLELDKPESVLAAFRPKCVTLGKQISLVRGDEVRHGTALDVDKSGGLLVEFADGHREIITSGEVSIRGMYGYV